MNGKTILTLLLGVALLTSLVPGALAQGTNTLGISENDLRDEPNHKKDNTGLDPGRDRSVGPQQSFPNAPLILESVYQTSADVWSEDLNNIVNRVQHGSEYDSYEYHIYPGLGWFKAYWGWWNDKGSGGSLQEDKVAEDDDHGNVVNTAQPGDANGAIDDANDDEHKAWDEFVWRGNNPAAGTFGYEQVGDDEAHDELYAFIQPGSHHVANAFLPWYDQPLDTHAEDGSIPDFSFQDSTADNSGWHNANGFDVPFYDASLVMTTTVTVAANPDTSGDGYDPHTPGGDAADHAVDVDVFSAVDPDVESLYRATVWDPNDQVQGPTDGTPVGDEGAKAFLKHDYPVIYDQTTDQVSKVTDPILAPFENAANGTVEAAGVVLDYAPVPFWGGGPFKHEPNTVQDRYAFAGYDADTAYGGLDKAYYRPGQDQTYTDYTVDEHLWADARATWGTPFYGVVLFAPWGWNIGSNVPDTSAPGEDVDERNQAPGFLQLEANVGTWFDRDGDTWVGNATDADPYAEGIVNDPNDYYDNPSENKKNPEWYGTCQGNWKVTLVPNTTNERWGTTGVYVVGGQHNPYTPAVEDATGGAGADTTKPVRDRHWAVDYVVPGEDTDDVQGGGPLSRYVTHGPISLTTYCNDASGPSGSWFAYEQVLFPEGNLDYEVTITSTMSVGDEVKSHNGGNEGKSFGPSGLDEQVVDVDVLTPFGN